MTLMVGRLRWMSGGDIKGRRMRGKGDIWSLFLGLEEGIGKEKKKGELKRLILVEKMILVVVGEYWTYFMTHYSSCCWIWARKGREPVEVP